MLDEEIARLLMPTLLEPPPTGGVLGSVAMIPHKLGLVGWKGWWGWSLGVRHGFMRSKSVLAVHRSVSDRGRSKIAYSGVYMA